MVSIKSCQNSAATHDAEDRFAGQDQSSCLPKDPPVMSKEGAAPAAQQRSGNAIRRIGINAASLLAGDVFNRGVTFAIYAIVARYCGAHAFGQLALGLILFHSFQVFASIGLPTLAFRDVSKHPQADGKYLVNTCAISCVTFLVVYALLGLFVLLSGYAPETTLIIMLFGLSILPRSLSLNTEAIFRRTSECISFSGQLYRSISPNSERRFYCWQTGMV